MKNNTSHLTKSYYFSDTQQFARVRYFTRVNPKREYAP